MVRSFRTAPRGCRDLVLAQHNARSALLAGLGELAPNRFEAPALIAVRRWILAFKARLGRAVPEPAGRIVEAQRSAIVAALADDDLTDVDVLARLFAVGRPL